MIVRRVTMAAEHCRPLKRAIWRLWYDALAYRFAGERSLTFLNYGFAPLGRLPECPMLQPADEPNRLFIQLYDHLARKVPLGGRDVLEVGCGRGGGSAYLRRYFAPKSVVGVDFSAQSIRFCRLVHAARGLSFLCADAERLPFRDESFDVVINVESSHCYGSIGRFFRHVARVLRPGGHFLYADFCGERRLSAFAAEVGGCPLARIEQSDITAHVVRALEIDSDRRRTLIAKLVPAAAVGLFEHFVGAKGSEVFEELSSGALRYHACVFQKKTATETADVPS
jgi:SAM-dependent methyltransferase